MNKFVIVIGLLFCLSVSCVYANEGVDTFVPSSGLKMNQNSTGMKIENFFKNNQVKNKSFEQRKNNYNNRNNNYHNNNQNYPKQTSSWT